MIAETVAALDRALARIAVSVAGTPQRADALLTSVGRGESDEFAASFLAQGAAMMRARRLLAEAGRRPVSLRKRAAAIAS